ncbi:hypothetical protein Tco_0615829 [Tanacetum coccineum]
MESCNPVGTPMEIKDKLDLDQNGSLVDATKYRSMIGALMCLTFIRSDIVHATCLCDRYQAKPTEKHLKEMLIMWDVKTPSRVLPVELNSLAKSWLDGPQRNKTIWRCQPRKQNMYLYPLDVPNNGSEVITGNRQSVSSESEKCISSGIGTSSIGCSDLEAVFYLEELGGASLVSEVFQVEDF